MVHFEMLLDIRAERYDKRKMVIHLIYSSQIIFTNIAFHFQESIGGIDLNLRSFIDIMHRIDQ